MSTSPLVRNWQLVRHTETALRNGSESLGNVPELLRALLSEEAWREFVLPNGETVGHCSFAAFVSTGPPRGLGATVDLVRRVIASDTVAVDLLDQALQNQPGRPPATGNNVPNNGRPEGNSEAKALRKLRKDSPDLHAEVLAGRLSAHRAMVQAGYRPRTLSVRLDNPEAAARSLRTHMEPADLMELIRLLAEAAADVLRGQGKPPDQ